jgi:hypothetical protein
VLLRFQCSYALLQFVHRAAGVVQRSLQAVAFCAQLLGRGQLPLTVLDGRLRRGQFGQQALAFCAKLPLLGGGSVAVLSQLGQSLVGVAQLGLQACGLVAQGLQLCLLVGACCARAFQFTAQTVALPGQGLSLCLELRKLLAGLLEGVVGRFQFVLQTCALAAERLAAGLQLRDLLLVGVQLAAGGFELRRQSGELLAGGIVGTLRAGQLLAQSALLGELLPILAVGALQCRARLFQGGARVLQFLICLIQLRCLGIQLRLQLLAFQCQCGAIRLRRPTNGGWLGGCRVAVLGGLPVAAWRSVAALRQCVALRSAVAFRWRVALGRPIAADAAARVALPVRVGAGLRVAAGLLGPALGAA